MIKNNDNTIGYEADKEKILGAIPFDSAQEAWFWFITAQQARNDGARFSASSSAIQRPCEPVDILKVLDGLYRQRRLKRDHLLVLRHYGRRNMPPDLRRNKEARAFYLWEEAFERMEPVLERKGIIIKQNWVTKHYAKNMPNLYEAQISLFDHERMAAQ